MRIAVYSRKSVWTGRGESIENQVEMCRQYIRSRIPGGGEAEIAVYEDEGFSGKDLERPQFRRMLADTRRMRTDYIVCYRLDRISRSVGDFAPLIEDLIARDIGFVCIKEQFDTSSPMGKAMMYIASVFAQLERETIAERVRDNMVLLARSGRWLGGPPPTGFAAERAEETAADGKAKRSCRLRWNPEEIGAARAVYREFQERRSLSGTAKALMHQGVLTRTGRHYSAAGVKEILRNPVYCIADRESRGYFLAQGADVCFDEEECTGKRGLLAYNKRDGSRQGAPRQEKSQWIVAVGRHKGIVSGREWVEIQALLDRNQPGSQPQSHNGYALLSGVLRCGICGERMFAKFRSNSSSRYDYICGAKLRGGSALCSCQNLSGMEADEKLCRFLGEYLREGPGLRRRLEELRRSMEKGEKEEPLEVLDAQIARCSREIGQLVDSLVRPGVSQALLEHVSSRVEALDAQVKALTARKEALEESLGERGTEGKKTEALAACLAHWGEGLEGLTLPERRELIRMMVEKIQWNGRECIAYLYGGLEGAAGPSAFAPQKLP